MVPLFGANPTALHVDLATLCKKNTVLSVATLCLSVLFALARHLYHIGGIAAFARGPHITVAVHYLIMRVVVAWLASPRATALLSMYSCTSIHVPVSVSYGIRDTFLSQLHAVVSM